MKTCDAHDACPLVPLFYTYHSHPLASNAKHDYSHNSSLHQVEIGSSLNTTDFWLHLSPFKLFLSFQEKDLSLPPRNIDPSTLHARTKDHSLSPWRPVGIFFITPTSLSCSKHLVGDNTLPNPTRFLLDSHDSAFDNFNSPTHLKYITLTGALPFARLQPNVSKDFFHLLSFIPTEDTPKPCQALVICSQSHGFPKTSSTRRCFKFFLSHRVS